MAFVGPVAVYQILTGKLWGLHPVFHISLLRKYEPRGDGVKPPPPIVVDEDDEYAIKPYFHIKFDEAQGSTLYAGGLRQQRRQLVERGGVKAQLEAFGSLQTAIWVTLICFYCLAVYFGTWWV